MGFFEYVDGELRSINDQLPTDNEGRTAAGFEASPALKWQVGDAEQYIAAFSDDSTGTGPWLIELSTADTTWHIRVPNHLPEVLRFVKEYGLVWMTANVDVDDLVDHAAKIAAGRETRVAEASRRRQMPDVRI